MPDTCWLGGLVANTGRAQLHSVVAIEPDCPLPAGGRRVGRSSRLRITAGDDCRLEVLRCLRPLDPADRPTWCASRRRAGAYWSRPGGGGRDDSRPIGMASLAAGRAATLDGDELADALQRLAAGEKVWLILRRVDCGHHVTPVSVQCDVQWLAGEDDDV